MSLPLISRLLVCAGLAAGAVVVSAAQDRPSEPPLTAEDRIAILRRSQVWTPIDTASVDIEHGPDGPGAFAPGETVTCDYVDRKVKGHSPKFDCQVGPEDEIKVKYGRQNGEVYGEVAATRLLWALGFGADRMYPVRVICRGCPDKLGGAPGAAPGEAVFDPATVERKAPGKSVETHPDEGWSWKELDLVEEAAGGAPTAHRDALKLLAALLQHGDNKPQQQRLVCLDEAKKKSGERKEPAGPDEEDPDSGIKELCAHPFMLINDLGLTFGRVDRLNRNQLGSVNFERWSQAPIWKKDERCVANLPKSMTGSLHDPVISEAGRQFLFDLLARLTDTQLHDLFEVARFERRTFGNASPESHTATIDEWVAAFKQKRQDIGSRPCVSPLSPHFSF